MAVPEPAVAIITTRLRVTMEDIKDRIKRFKLGERTGILNDGRPFFIASSSQQLRGRDLLDYEVYRYSEDARESRVIDEMVEIAQARFEATQARSQAQDA